MARKFLYVIVVLILLAIAGAFAYRFFGKQLMRMALVPSEAFVAAPPEPAAAYADRKMWIARPDLPGNPAMWTPPGYGVPAAAPVAVFYIHPTSYIDRAHWNAPADDERANSYADLFTKGQASAFNQVGQIWAPRYRQATFGAFLTGQKEAGQALDLAYRDVLAAFDAFVQQIGPDRPIILAGHSQGSLHLTRLLRDRIAGTPLAQRIVAVYAIGWPISRTADLSALGLPECRAADQSGCILSWQSFAEPADPSQVLDLFDQTTGPTSIARRGTALVCTNPLTGTADATAPASANLGTLTSSADFQTATMVANTVPAACIGRGILSIGAPIDMGKYVLPGNNYHVYDYSLFWANIRADAARRFAAFSKR
ncbi:MAG: DUF3089 domain-containing protein [Sphingomonas sp.]|uniref:DUF3089 domain-containing protein n=1 Tax=Sphingomonas sp. TaxID=28214 RepID=UPI001AC5AE09|nr:DUF3089 domain-containing protein [Sphingomonas sp.]MBN8807607.1 DUF3089 domain-containing protein [Sphingomonas sp.]